MPGYSFWGLIVLLVFGGCSSSEEPAKPQVVSKANLQYLSTPEVKMIDPMGLHRGPARRMELNHDQLSRLRYLKDVFKDVDPTPLQDWVEDFKRDLDPDHEIQLWEKVARVFGEYTFRRKLELEARREVFQVILLRTGLKADEVIEQIKLKHLTENDAYEIMDMWWRLK